MLGYIDNIMASWLCFRFEYIFEVKIAENNQILDMKYMGLNGT
jgi:hypothetical protein